ncbi:MAG: hypothetical protein IJZ85_04340 [Lachnospiraceae bacterium]|nr:hypothetical protein [Lachnospiraceae bacterium]
MKVNNMNLSDKIEFLRQNPIFWTRFGIEYESGDWEKHARNAKRHKALYNKGIVVHSSVIPSGWIGPDQYDYTETDQLMELLFSTCPDIIFLPRVKLNVPSGWLEKHPEDVFVYADGPRTREEISAMIGTSVHGSHPPKQTDLLAQQSFSSACWVEEASEALRRFILHMEQSKWASQIIGYHIAYGTCGETTQWASWDPNPRLKGDYGISATKAFLEYAKAHGKDYDDIPAIDERFFISDTPVPENRFHVGTPTIDQLFYHAEQDERCVLYSEFTRDSNADAAEAFCKVAKEIVPNKVTGIFYGYIAEPDNCANMQHTGFDRILSSPYIDFLSSPKGYTRVGPTDPGFGQAVPNSVSRKKLYLDELDNRTHLYKKNSRRDGTAQNFEQTRAAYWREFTENIAFHQGYWWMDLEGGWLDSEEIQDEVALLKETSKKLYLERKGQKGVSEVLLVINEDVMHHMRPNYNLHYATIEHVGATIKESGVPVDFYRTADLEEIDLSGYKLIVFLNAFCEDREKLHQILKKTSADCHILWNYTAGILDKRSGSFGFDNVRRLTGFSMGEYPIGGIAEHADSCYPVVYIQPDEAITSLEYYSDGQIKTAKRRDSDGRTHILSAMPRDMTVESAREMLTAAGVHFYAPAYCTVNADNRFLYVLAEKKMCAEITLKEPTTCRNEFTGEIFKNADTISAEMEEGTCIFLKYIRE